MVLFSTKYYHVKFLNVLLWYTVVEKYMLIRYTIEIHVWKIIKVGTSEFLYLFLMCWSKPIQHACKKIYNILMFTFMCVCAFSYNFIATFLRVLVCVCTPLLRVPVFSNFSFFRGEIHSSKKRNKPFQCDNNKLHTK